MKKNRFNFQIITLLIVILIFSCQNSSKSNEINSQELKSKTDTVLDYSESEIIGDWIRQEVDGQVVIDELGLPEQKGEDKYWGATGTYVQNWDYTSLGISFEMESINQNEAKKVFSITIFAPCKLTTSQKVGIGTTKDIVLDKYSSHIDKSNSNENIIVVGSIYGGTIFTLENGVVSKIFIGAIAE